MKTRMKTPAVKHKTMEPHYTYTGQKIDGKPVLKAYIFGDFYFPDSPAAGWIYTGVARTVKDVYLTDTTSTEEHANILLFQMYD